MILQDCISRLFAKTGGRNELVVEVIAYWPVDGEWVFISVFHYIHPASKSIEMVRRELDAVSEQRLKVRRDTLVTNQTVGGGHFWDNCVLTIWKGLDFDQCISSKTILQDYNSCLFAGRNELVVEILDIIAYCPLGWGMGFDQCCSLHYKSINMSRLNLDAVSEQLLKGGRNTFDRRNWWVVKVFEVIV